MAKAKKIRVLVEDCKTIAFGDLLELEFNDLKEATDRDVSKLKKAITDRGFITPFFIWRMKYVIDGAGRSVALRQLAEEGYSIPDLPYVSIKARSMKQAREFVVMVSSQHGKITQESFELFTADLEVDYELIEIPTIDMPTFIVDETIENEVGPTYSKKIDTPVYEMTGEKPDVGDLFDDEYAQKLFDAIDESDLEADVKTFLTLAAYRHVRINFGKVAEFYAHSDADVQRLIEDSALVIVDFDKSIERGWIRMNEELANAYRSSE
jgi:hypothetical protein